MQNRKVKRSQPRPLVPEQLKKPLATRSKWPWTPMHRRSATWTLKRGRYFQMMEAPAVPRRVAGRRKKPGRPAMLKPLNLPAEERKIDPVWRLVPSWMVQQRKTARITRWWKLRWRIG